MVRWLQLGAFHPVMRVHSMGNNVDGAAETEAEQVKKAEATNRQDQEPWVFGEPHTSHARAAIELRYRLLPYLYTAFQQHRESGLPILRNLFFYDQTDANCRKFGDQFLCGEDLLVAPVVKPRIKSMQVYLPKGEWTDFFTGKQYRGGKKYRISIVPERFPLFVRGGSILPLVEPVQHTGEIAGLKELELRVYLTTPTGQGQLYWDAGEGYDYEQDGFLRANYTFKQGKKKLRITQARSGAYRPAFRRAIIRFYGELQGKKATVDGKKVRLERDRYSTFLSAPFDFEEVQVF